MMYPILKNFNFYIEIEIKIEINNTFIIDYKSTIYINHKNHYLKNDVLLYKK